MLFSIRVSLDRNVWKKNTPETTFTGRKNPATSDRPRPRWHAALQGLKLPKIRLWQNTRGKPRILAEKLQLSQGDAGNNTGRLNLKGEL